MKLHTRKYADVSTGHIREKDVQALEADADYYDENLSLLIDNLDTLPRLIVFSYDGGFFVHTQVAEDPEEFVNLKERYSTEILQIIAAANQQQCVFVRFDADGDVYPDLPELDEDR